VYAIIRTGGKQYGSGRATWYASSDSRESGRHVTLEDVLSRGKVSPGWAALVIEGSLGPRQGSSRIATRRSRLQVQKRNHYRRTRVTASPHAVRIDAVRA